jgi:hypothetical protein
LKPKLLGIFLLGFLIAGGYFWLKREYHPRTAIAHAETFVALLRENRFSEAYELTTKTGGAGNSLEQFTDLAKRQFCDLKSTDYSFPFQSNGNRLRRWLKGQPLDMNQITVEFSGACLFGVSMQSSADSEWKVYMFQSHAG